MTRNERAQLIIDALKDRGFEYEVLNESGGIPNHVRVKGFGDIWPTSGTFKQGSKITRKNLNLLIEKLGFDENRPQHQPKRNVDRITALEEKVCYLEAALNRLLANAEECDQWK